MAGKKKAASSGREARSATNKKIRIQYYRSSIGFNEQQKLIVKGLGFNKLNTTREVVDTPSIRGMIKKVPHLVRIVEQ
ncbi:MAG: 50S ribosomal protein L30 [Acidobacteria bacterium]|nr:50S ribosomal protein L30 [Acidobacteriota bacterium]